MKKQHCAMWRSIILALVLGIAPATWGANWTGTTGLFMDDSNWDTGEVPDFGLEEAVINNGGTAQFVLDDAVDVVALRMGLNGGSGSYEQSGGLFMATGAFIGDNSTGSASISNGEFMIGGDSIHVGWRPNGEGVLDVSGAETLVVSADDFQLGREGTGTLNFSGGQIRAGYTVIGKFGTGTWNQTGGLFDQDFGDVEIGDGGRDDQSGTAGPRYGTLNLSGDGIIQTSGHLAIGNRRGGGAVNVSGGVLALTGGDDSTLYIGRGNDSSPGSGGPTSLRVEGGESLIVVNGELLMNPQDVSSSSTLIAAITGTAHSTIYVAGNADVTAGTLKVELDGYTPQADDVWTLVEAGVETDTLQEAIDDAVEAMGYDPLAHGFPVNQGEIIGPFAGIDTSMAPLGAGLSWDVEYTGEQITLRVVGSPTIPGDFNGNGVLDAADINDLSEQVRNASTNLDYDVNMDGAVNGADRTYWVDVLKGTYLGDSNLDGEFSSADFVLVFQAGQYEDATPGNSVWETGDWNGDGDFGSSDFVVAFQAGGFEQGPRAAVAAVPEPSTACLMLICSMFAAFAGRRRLHRNV